MATYCEHGTDLEVRDCRKCDEIDRDTFARSLYTLSNEAFHEAMATYDRQLREQREQYI